MVDYNKWAVIGAGPAGITTVGKLIDSGIHPQEILWIDPDFEVGDFGKKWKEVLGNSTVGEFIGFLNSCQAFQYHQWANNFEINNFNEDSFCRLQYVSEPLQWITDHLRQKVKSIKTIALEIKQSNQNWNIKTEVGIIIASNVVLAVGAVPKQLPVLESKNITLEQALDPILLAEICTTSDTVGVFGSSHTAVVVIYNLIKLGVNVINFYRSPLKYALTIDDYTIFDYSGLKGYSAEWARNYMEDPVLPNLQRVFLNDSCSQMKIEICTKLVFAIGFERRKYPVISPYADIQYDHFIGIIANGLFGIGIGFPQLKRDKLGICEYAIGLKDFSDYLDQVLNIWLKYK